MSEVTGGVARASGARLPLLVLGFAVFVAVVYELLPIGLLTPIARDFGVDEQGAGLLVSAFSVLVVVGSIPLSAVTARFNARTTLAVVLVTFCLSAGIMAFTTSFGVALAARALGGVAHAVLFTAVYRIALSVVAPERRAVAATTVSAGNAMALALGVPLATALANLASWRLPFTVVAGVFALLAIAVFLLLPKTRTEAGEPLTTRLVLRAAVQPGLLRVAVTIIVVLLAHFLTYTYVEPLLRGAGVPQQGVVLVLFGYGMACLVGLLAVTRFTHAHPGAALRVTLVFVLAVVIAIGLTRDSAWGITIAVIAWGVGFGAMPVLLNVLAIRASLSLPAVAAPVSNTAFNIGITLGAIVGGQAITLTGTGGLGFVSAGVLALIVLVILIPRWLPRDGHLD
ncbi:MAG: MFS transporter [Herbiconiux sp.]|uniref:MFS transporter n=1 Tax=Herbiconiux sp. TaxID=1871186 RepID=UPI00121464CA|nr:MFS transporter [Herbiconiux sp.]TAJ46085.1 MAG: MFS transporter [Herbiconiux sp.]